MPLTARAGGAGHARAHRPRLDRVVPASARCCRPPIRCCPPAVVTNPRVPRLIRHSLNLESGLNDGLALPAVLALHRGRRGRRRLRLVAVRAPGRARRRASPALVVGVRGVAPDAAQPRLGHDVARTRRRSTRSAWRSPPTARPCCRPRATASSPSSWRDRARHPAAGHPRVLRGALRGHDRGREARRVPGVRRDPHLRRAVRRRLGGGGDRAPSRCWSRGRSPCSRRWPARGRSDTRGEGVHGLVRAEGRGHHDLRPARARLERPGGRADRRTSRRWRCSSR